MFCVGGVVVVVVGHMAKLAAHRISFGHKSSNGKVGFCAKIANRIRKILQILQIRNPFWRMFRIILMLLRCGRRYYAGGINSTPTPYRYVIRSYGQKGDHLEEHFVTLFEDQH